MAVYQKPATGVTLNTTNSLWQLIAAAAGQARLLESYVGGEATTSTVLRLALARNNAAGVGAVTAYTPNKLNSRSPAAGSTVNGGLSALVSFATSQETLFDPVVLHAFNAFGGTDRWVPQPGEELYVVNSEGVSARSLSGTPVVSAHAIFEEL